MTKRKLRKNADISPPQSPHDGIHTCSRGCKKPGCTRTLRDTIEEQNQQIEALKRDVLEKTAELRNLKEVVSDLRISAEDDLDSIETARSENAGLKEHNEALCERMQDLNGEVHTASCANANMHKENARLKAEVERLTKAGDNLEQVLTEISYAYRAGNASHEWRAAKKGKQS